MKLFFTIALISLTTILSAQQVNYEPARSIMNDNVVASIENSFFVEALVEVSNEFNLDFTANPVFGDITISYNLDASADVRLEVEKVGSQVVALVDGIQNTGTQNILWDENIGSGEYTIRLIVGSKVETKTLNLSY